MRLGSHALVVYRRTRGEMPAIPEEVLESEREGAELSFLLQPVDILGKKGRVTGVRFVRCRLGEPDSSGRRRPVPIKGAFQEYPADAVLLATGEDADLRFLPRGYVLGHNGTIIDDAGREVEGVFAGGDLTTSVKMVSNAIGTGKVAAAVFDKYLSGADWSEALAEIEHSPTSFAVDRLEQASGAPPRSSEVVDSTGINFAHFPRLSRAATGKLSPAEAIRSFAEVSQGFDRATAEAEARRCFHCAVCSKCDNCFVFCPEGVIRRKPGGGYEIDLTYCKGCGICAEECPRGAISIVRESRAL
jgi:2-oxoacid:acceptor oxidoreductase delta subunit (pyruvate/2-ketoisovalerate family)